MRNRSSGESRIKGRKAVGLVLTVATTILLYRRLKRQQ
jgi:hypothetical protein